MRRSFLPVFFVAVGLLASVPWLSIANAAQDHSWKNPSQKSASGHSLFSLLSSSLSGRSASEHSASVSSPSLSESAPSRSASAYNCIPCYASIKESPGLSLSQSLVSESLSVSLESRLLNSSVECLPPLGLPCGSGSKPNPQCTRCVCEGNWGSLLCDVCRLGCIHGAPDKNCQKCICVDSRFHGPLCEKENELPMYAVLGLNGRMVPLHKKLETRAADLLLGGRRFSSLNGSSASSRWSGPESKSSRDISRSESSQSGLIATDALMLSNHKLKNVPLEALETTPALKKSFALYYMSVLYDGFAEFGWDSIIRGFKGRIVRILPSPRNKQKKSKAGVVPPQGLIVEGPYEMYEDLSPSKDNTLVLSMVPVPPEHKLSMPLQLIDRSERGQLVRDLKLQVLSDLLERVEKEQSHRTPTTSRTRVKADIKHRSPHNAVSPNPTLLQLRDEITNGASSETHAYLSSVLEIESRLRNIEATPGPAEVSLQFTSYYSQALPNSMQQQHDTLFERAAEALELIGVAFETEKSGPGYGVVRVSVEHVKKAAMAIAELPDCLAVEIADKDKPANHWASAIQFNSAYKAAVAGAELATRINRRFANEFGLDGRGQIVAIPDSGLDRSHCFFRHSPSENPVNHGRVEVSDIVLRGPAAGLTTNYFYKITSLSFSALHNDGSIDDSIPPKALVLAVAHGGRQPNPAGSEVSFPGLIAHIEKIEHDVDKGFLTAFVGAAPNLGGPYTNFGKITFSETIHFESGLWQSRSYPTSVLRFAHPRGYRMKQGMVSPSLGQPIVKYLAEATVRFFPVEHRKIVRYFAGQCDSEDVPNGHGTHVAGSAAGHCDVEGEKATLFSGVAPKAKIVFVDVSARIKTRFGVEKDAAGQPRYLDMMYGAGARIYSSSSGSYKRASASTGYTSTASTLDSYVYYHRDFLLLHSAGNEGDELNRLSTDGTVNEIPHAKNIVAVGAVRNHRESWTRFEEGEYNPATGLSDSPCQTAWKTAPTFQHFTDRCTQLIANPDFEADILADYSSKGPCRKTEDGFTDLGRIKPDLLATGDVIVSARSHSNLHIRDAPFATHSIIYNSNIAESPAVLNHVAHVAVENGATEPFNADSIYQTQTQTGINAGSRLFVDVRRYSKNGNVCLDTHFTFSIQVESSSGVWEPLMSVDGHTQISVPRLPDDLTRWHRVEYNFHELTPHQRTASPLVDRNDVGAWQPNAKAAAFRIFQQAIPHRCSLIFTRFDLVKASAVDPSKFDTITHLLLNPETHSFSRFSYTSQQGFAAPNRLDMSELHFKQRSSANVGDDRFVVIGPFDMSAGARIELEHVKGPRIGHAVSIEFKLIFQVKNHVSFVWENAMRGSCVAVPTIPVDSIPRRYMLDCPPEYSAADSGLAKNRYADPTNQINKERKYARLLIQQLNSFDSIFNHNAFRIRFLVVRTSSLDSSGSLISMSGTSMATPVAAGTFTVIRQYFTDGFHVEGRRRFADGFNPSAALLRAVALNTAKDISNGAGGHYTLHSISPVPNTGAETDWIRGYPGYGQGFGRIFAGKALFVQQNDPAQNHKLIVFNKVDQIVNGGQTFKYRLLVPQRARSELRVMLSYVDIALSPTADNEVVQHVIALKVTDAMGTYKNEISDPADFGTAGYETKNNNNKRVIIAENDVVAGVYIIELTATAPAQINGLNADVFTFNQRLPDFALVAHGPRLARVDHLYHVRIELPEYPPARHTGFMVRTCELTVTTYSGVEVKRSFECPLRSTIYVLTLQEPIDLAIAVTVNWQRAATNAPAVDAAYLGILDFFSGTLYECAPCTTALMIPNDAQLSTCILAIATAPVAVAAGNTRHRFEVTIWSPDIQQCSRVREVNQDLELQMKLEVSSAIDVIADVVRLVDSGAAAFGRTTKDFRNMDTVHHRTIEDEWAAAAERVTITNLVITKAGAGLMDGAGNACTHWDIRKIRVHHVNSKTTWAWESQDGPWTVSTTDLKLGLPTWTLDPKVNSGALCGMCHRMMDWSYEFVGGHTLTDMKTAVCAKILSPTSKNLIIFERCAVVAGLLDGKVNALAGDNFRAKVLSYCHGKPDKPTAIFHMCTTDLKVCGGGVEPNSLTDFDLNTWNSEY